MVSGGTDNHLLLLDLVDTDLSGMELENLLGEAKITVNKNMVPRDRRKPSETSGVRIGTPAVTTRGLREADCMQIAELMDSAFKGGGDQAQLDRIRFQVNGMMRLKPLFGW